jgi:DNA-binding NtrC family response regulator
VAQNGSVRRSVNVDADVSVSERRDGLWPPTRARGRVTARDTQAWGIIMGESTPMRAMYRQVERLASSDLRTFIQGESGTGKSLVALALHRSGPRSGGPFLDRCLAKASPMRVRGFTGRAMRGLGSYSWPGNVRQLENWIESAVILADDELIDLQHFRELELLPVTATCSLWTGLTLSELERRYTWRPWAGWAATGLGPPRPPALPCEVSSTSCGPMAPTIRTRATAMRR